jgi:tRNA(Phe) wybutosine-synthesizing methylase Tyw3
MCHTVPCVSDAMSAAITYVRQKNLNMAETLQVTASITNGFRAEGIEALRDGPGN